jgi:autotransporter-associated beta strand protein
MKNRILIRASSFTAVAAVAILFCHPLSIHAETWNLPAGGSWNSSANWNPMGIPNAIGANATFNNAASALNPAQNANRTVTTDAAQTVGSIHFNNDAANTFTMSITAGTSGSLIFDEAGAGPATINVAAVLGTGNNTISAPVTLTDSLVATVNDITASSAAGALNLTATISGPGGFTKLGDGLATFGTGTKTYTGPTVLSGGRMRISVTAQPSLTSSFTVNSGAQLTPITAGTLILGSGTVNLNGIGPTTGPFAPFPGAIRPDTSLIISISNAVVLQSDTLLHMQGAAGSITLLNTVSGPGQLTFTSPSHDANLGTLALVSANTYAGGTIVHGGTVSLGSPAATLGAGNVTVQSANLAFAGSTAKLLIATGVNNAIADTATLTLAGGKAAGVADDGFVELQSGVNENVAGLVLGGVAQALGTYGSTASSATVKNDEYFSGPGIITVAVPTVRPALKIVRTAPNVIISWPTNFTGFVLQEATTLLTNNTAWTDVTNPAVVISGTNNTITLNASSGNDFFRLMK